MKTHRLFQIVLCALAVLPAAGVIEIDWIRLCKPDGTPLKAWDFKD